MSMMKILAISGQSVSRGSLMKECILKRGIYFGAINSVFPGAHYGNK
jgi:hypothetical protein